MLVASFISKSISLQIATISLTIRNCATPDTENLLKKTPLDMAPKYVETYSSSNAAARDPEVVMKKWTGTKGE